MAGERDYLSRHPTCEMCGTKKAVFVTTGADTAALCYTCGNAYMKKGHAIVEVDRLDSINPNSVYGREWDEIARKYLADHPYCERCAKQGKRTKAALVHHMQYVRSGGGNGNSNLQALCHHCHEEIHKRRKVDHMDNLDVRQAREDMATPEQALAELQAAEKEMYWETDKDRADKADNVLNECRARQDNATSEDEALEALQDYEANLYLKEDN